MNRNCSRMFPLLLHLNSWGVRLAEDTIWKRNLFISFFKSLEMVWIFLFSVQESWPSANAPVTSGQSLSFSGGSFSWGESGPH